MKLNKIFSNALSIKLSFLLLGSFLINSVNAQLSPTPALITGGSFCPLTDPAALDYATQPDLQTCW